MIGEKWEPPKWDPGLRGTVRYHKGAARRKIRRWTFAAGFDDLDARLARVGYSPKSLAEQFDLTQTEARRFLKGKLDTDRTTEPGDIMRQAGLPI